MTVIFQLFSVDDIRRLGRNGPDELKAFIKQALENYKTRQPYGIQDINEPAKFVLNASDETLLESKEKTPPQILNAIKKRFEEVRQQLISSQPGGLADSSHLDPQQELFPQLFDQQSGQRIPGSEEDLKILQWAISCEVNNFNFYFELLQVKEKAYQWFFERTGQRPKGPDSIYSPFNPLHPLYNLFYNLELESNLPEDQEGSTSTP